MAQQPSKGRKLGIAAMVTVVVLAGLCMGLRALSSQQHAYELANTDCSGAVQAARNYQAPGQWLTVGAMVPLSLAREAERRPVQPIGWSNGGPSSGQCMVRYQFSRGNETQTAYWWYDPKTGKVEAGAGDGGQLAERLSGW